MTKAECPICLSGNKTILMENRLNIYRCDSCRHTFTDVSKEKQEKYNNDYFLKMHSAWFNNPNYRIFDFIYKELLRLSGKEQLRLFDIGCGKGDFLKYISAKDSTAKLFGIDLVYNQHPGIHFIKGSFYDLEAKKFETKFNVICSLVVIEHIDNPHLFMQKVNSLLEFNGLLCIMTMNNNSLMYRIARLLNKVGIHTPHDRLYSLHHLQHFTNQSLKKLVEMNGFDILLRKNHNYSMESVDVPESSFLIEKMYKSLVWLIFLLSSAFGCGTLQTIVCKKKSIL